MPHAHRSSSLADSLAEEVVRLKYSSKDDFDVCTPPWLILHMEGGENECWVIHAFSHHHI